MKLITERILINGVADAWEKQYKYSHHQRHRDVLNELIKLRLNATTVAVDIEKIIGDKGWTEVPECTECNQAAEAVVELGEPLDNDSATVTLCVKCLKEALALAGVRN